MACRMLMLRKMKEANEKEISFKHDDRNKKIGGREDDDDEEDHAIVFVAKKEGDGGDQKNRKKAKEDEKGFGAGIGSDTANESKDHHLYSHSLQHSQHLTGHEHGKQQREVDPLLTQYDAWFAAGAPHQTAGTAQQMLVGAQGEAANSTGGLELGTGISGHTLVRGEGQKAWADTKKGDVLDQSFDAAATIPHAHPKGLELRSDDSPHSWQLLTNTELLEQASTAAKDLKTFVPPKKRKFDTTAEYVAAPTSPVPSSLITSDVKVESFDCHGCFQHQDVSASSALLGENSNVNSYLLQDHFVPLMALQSDDSKPLPKKKRLFKVKPETTASNDVHAVAPTSLKNARKLSLSGKKSKKIAKKAGRSTDQSALAPNRKSTISLKKASGISSKNVRQSDAARTFPHRKPNGSVYYVATLADEDDEKHLAPLQCEFRKHLEVFEADPEDVQGSKRPGRKGLITLGQVGIRCIYCAREHRSRRSVGGVTFSCSIPGVYQIAQNMMNLHLIQRCTHTPKEVKRRLRELQSIGARSRGKMTKAHWKVALQKQGIYEVQRDGDAQRLVRDESLVWVHGIQVGECSNKHEQITPV
ncbi:MAG: hypothetical protein SGILL_007785 [Bacillariaceae sp.]